MKNVIVVVGLAVAAVMSIAPVFAASGIVLINSGLGQKSGNVTNFGVAVCNNGTGNLAQAVPIRITANGQTGTVSSPAPLQAGSCGYSYISYATFNMSRGQTYSVAVTIDPNRTVVSNTNTQAAYSITVPSGRVLGASIDSTSQAAMLNQLAGMVTILEQLLAKARSLGL
jgi:hypothetical protein